MKTAETFLKAIDESVDTFYRDDDYEAFSERQKALWDEIHELGLQDEVQRLMIREFEKSSDTRNGVEDA